MQIFLSSADADRHIAARLARRLSASGHRVVYPDYLLGAGDNWTLKIGEALERSDAMVAVISSKSRKSDLYKREVDFALGSEGFEGRLVSVLVGRSKPFPWILKRLPVVRYNEKRESIEEIAIKISELLSIV